MFGHVNLSSRREVELAIGELSGKEIGGHKILVQRARKAAPRCSIAARTPRKLKEAGNSIDEAERDNNGVTRDADELPTSFDLQGRNNQSSPQTGSQPIFRDPSLPPVPPPGYAWFLRQQWALVPIDDQPTVQSSDAYVRYNEGDDGQKCTGSESFGEQNRHLEVPLRASAPSPPIKTEDPMGGIDLNSADDSPPATDRFRTKVKAEDRETPVLPPPAPISLKQRKTQSKKMRSLRFPFKCSCKNQFQTDREFQKHLQKHQGQPDQGQ